MNRFHFHPHQWPPHERYVLSMDSDETVKNVRRVLTLTRNIPKSNLMKFDIIKGCDLSKLTLKSRLYIVSHGNALRVATCDPGTLHGALKLFGLKNVGVIKLVSCDSGVGTFLENFLACIIRAGEINVGYISGMKGSYYERRRVEPFFGAPGGRLLVHYRSFGPHRTVGGNWTPEYFGIRTIKGNVNIRFPGTRYDIA